MRLYSRFSLCRSTNFLRRMVCSVLTSLGCVQNESCTPEVQKKGKIVVYVCFRGAPGCFLVEALTLPRCVKKRIVHARAWERGRGITKEQLFVLTAKGGPIPCGQALTACTVQKVLQPMLRQKQTPEARAALARSPANVMPASRQPTAVSIMWLESRLCTKLGAKAVRWRVLSTVLELSSCSGSTTVKFCGENKARLLTG